MHIMSQESDVAAAAIGTINNHIGRETSCSAANTFVMEAMSGVAVLPASTLSLELLK
jgi:hypothetical protein